MARTIDDLREDAAGLKARARTVLNVIHDMSVNNHTASISVGAAIERIRQSAASAETDAHNLWVHLGIYGKETEESERD